MERNFKAVWEKALENLEAEEVKLIESHLSVIDIPAKQPIFSEGDDSDSIFIVRYGRVSLLYSTEEGNVYVKGFWSRGYVVGLISALLQERHNYHSEAIVDSSLFVFPRAALFECMRKIPQFSINIAKSLALFANDASLRITAMALYSAESRLIRVLIELAEKNIENKNTEYPYFVQGVTQENIGNMIGASRVWVNKTLSSLEKLGLILREKHLIHIKDLNALESFSQK